MANANITQDTITEWIRDDVLVSHLQEFGTLKMMRKCRHGHEMRLIGGLTFRCRKMQAADKKKKKKRIPCNEQSYITKGTFFGKTMACNMGKLCRFVLYWTQKYKNDELDALSSHTRCSWNLHCRDVLTDARVSKTPIGGPGKKIELNYGRMTCGQLRDEWVLTGHEEDGNTFFVVPSLSTSELPTHRPCPEDIAQILEWVVPGSVLVVQAFNHEFFEETKDDLIGMKGLDVYTFEPKMYRPGQSAIGSLKSFFKGTWIKQTWLLECKESHKDPFIAFMEAAGKVAYDDTPIRVQKATAL